MGGQQRQQAELGGGQRRRPGHTRAALFGKLGLNRGSLFDQGAQAGPPLEQLGFVITASNAGIRVLFAMGREHVLPRPLTRLSHRHTPAVAIGALTALTLALGLPLTYADGGGPAFGYLAGAGGLAVVLVYLTGNLAVIRAFRTEFRDEFQPWRHLIIPAIAILVFLFPLWGILHPPGSLRASPAWRRKRDSPQCLPGWLGCRPQT